MSKNIFQDRHLRHQQLKGFGKSGVEKLGTSTILMVGAGGLACGSLPYLVSSGLEKIVILDAKSLKSSNLARQGIYGEKDVGLKKSTLAKQYCEKQNCAVIVDSVCKKLEGNNAEEWIDQVYLVIDGSDNIKPKS